jgi:hypothetical protein
MDPRSVRAPGRPRFIDCPAVDEREKKDRIARGHDQGLCPNCWSSIEPGGGVGSGRLADGIFCGLDCQAAFHKDYYRERARASNPPQN